MSKCSRKFLNIVICPICRVRLLEPKSSNARQTVERRHHHDDDDGISMDVVETVVGACEQCESCSPSESSYDGGGGDFGGGGSSGSWDDGGSSGGSDD